MHERFLSGADLLHIDYQLIDLNSEYDNLKILEQDKEDLWFQQDEDNHEKELASTEYTGVLDY